MSRLTTPARQTTRWASGVLVAFALLGLLPLDGVRAQAIGERAPSAAAPLAQNLDDDGLALHGYDPVAYFTDASPTKGLPSLVATVHGATYRFSTPAHRAAFLENPSRYLPAYGGFCAYGVATGGKFDIDPKAWRIVDGTLYLNKNPGVQRLWLRDVPGNIERADGRWPEVAGKPMR